MSRAFDAVTAWTVKRPRLVSCLLLVLSGTAILGYAAPQRVSGLFAPRFERRQAAPTTADASVETPPDVDPVNLGGADAILVVESDEFFTPRGAMAIRQVAEVLESLDHVENILWMDRVPILNIFGLPEPLFPRSDASVERFAAAQEKALRHPLVGGQLVSTDGRTLLMLIKFDWLFVESDEDCTTRLSQVANAAAAEFPDVSMSFLLTGRVPMYVTAMNARAENQLRYQLIGYGMVAVMALILFRGLTAVVIVALAPALGVFWTLGMLRFLDLADNPFNDVVLPVLLSMVGLTDGVHLMVQIRRLRANGMNARDAAKCGLREVGLACGLTSLTTAVGFGSLSLAHHRVVQEFGWCCVMGVLLTFVAVITVIPLACSSRLGRRLHVGHAKGLVDRQLGRIGGLVEFVLARSRLVSSAAIGATLLFAVVSLSLRPDERTANALPLSSEAAVALRRMDQALGGLELSAVDLSWSKQIEPDSPEILEVISQVDDLLDAEPLIGQPLSIRNLLEALPGEGNPRDRMSMLELLPPPLKRAFYTPERREAKVSFRVQDLGIAKYGPVFQRIESGLDSIVGRHPEFSFELAGSAVWRWRNLYQIVVDLAASLGTAMVIILIVLTIVYRSWRIGLISLVPNLFPLAVTGTFLVLTGQALELVSVCAFTVCLGIAVDDTIHFLTRYQEERSKTHNEHDAIRGAFIGVGTALIMTTVILVAGFATVLCSDSRDHRIFAAMGGLTIAAALFGDLIFLPALLARFTRKKPDGSP